MLLKFRQSIEDGHELASQQLITCYRALLILCLIAANYSFEDTRKKTKGMHLIRQTMLGRKSSVILTSSIQKINL
jgi:hypothetical protein